jgi:hypothetical protein
MAKKPIDALKAKQKKQKILAAVLGVAFLGLLAFQVPRVMKMMKTPPNPHAGETTATTTTPAGTPSLAAPTLRGAEQPTTSGAAPAGSLTAAPAPTVQDGELASFSRFASKDPFSQQLSDEKTSAPSSSGGSTGGSGSGSGSRGSTVPQVPSSAPHPGSAVISVNGTLYTVATNSDFPQATAADPSATPLFHLVSVTAHSAKISIVGGSYSSGSATVTLTENKPVTLVNTADGTRYRLILKPLGTDVSTGAPATGSGRSSGSNGTGTTSTTPASTSTTVTLPSP